MINSCFGRLKTTAVKQKGANKPTLSNFSTNCAYCTRLDEREDVVAARCGIRQSYFAKTKGMTRCAKTSNDSSANSCGHSDTEKRPHWHTRTKLHHLPLALQIFRRQETIYTYRRNYEQLAADIEEHKVNSRNEYARGLRNETRSQSLAGTENSRAQRSAAKRIGCGAVFCRAGHRFHAPPAIPPASPVVAVAVCCRLRALPELFCPSKLSPRSPKILLVLVSYLRSRVGGSIALAGAHGIRIMKYNFLVHAVDNDARDRVR